MTSSSQQQLACLQAVFVSRENLVKGSGQALKLSDFTYQSLTGTRTAYLRTLLTARQETTNRFSGDSDNRS